MQVKPYETTMTDTKPFNHGEEGTHSVCNKHNIGGKSICCKCSGKVGCGDEPMIHTDKILEEFDEKFPPVECSAHERTSSALCICEDLPDINAENVAIKSFLADSIHQAVAEERARVRGLIGEDEMAISQSSMNSGRMSKQEAFIVEIRNKFRTELKAKIKDLEEKTNL